MRIVLSDFMSLDGVVQAPGGREEDTDGGFAHGGWSMPFFDPDVMGSAIGEAMARTEALLFGRRTWQTMAAAWPERAGDPFADQMNSIPKHVASRTLTQDELDWPNSTLLPPDDAIGAVRALREQAGGDINVMGSPSFAAQLIENDLIDEYLLMVEPILLGGGKRLFPSDGLARPLELISTATTSTGVLICTYRPAPTQLLGRSARAARRVAEWPDGPPQQIHLDLWVEDLHGAPQEAVALGAWLLDAAEDLEAKEGFQVYAGSGRGQFCLCWG